MRYLQRVAIACVVSACGAAMAAPQPFEKVGAGFEPVVSTSDGTRSLWNVYRKGEQLLAEIPGSKIGKRFFVVPTVAGGDPQAGVYSIWHNRVGRPSMQLYWKKIGDNLALIEPNLRVRSQGDAESRAATKRVYTDRVVLTVPIVARGPNGGHVIDLDHLFLRQSGAFFGGFLRGAKTELAEIKSAKAFPYNIEVTIEIPRADGRIVQVHYSIGTPPPSRGFKPRIADRRVGFFYTDFVDRSKNDGESQKIRYANRWNLEKRDKNLKLSPPKQPIVYYIEHTTPVRYRKWVREGILAWNKAFEQVGITGAIEVRQQDAQTGAYMDIDPEDIRYSFVRWTNSHMGFAIGPVHVHPETGEIYEADIVMDEVFISGWAQDHETSQLATEAMRAFDAETVAWFEDHPEWDPRYRLALPGDRARVLAYLEARRSGRQWEGEVPPTMAPRVWQEVDPEIAARGGLCNALFELNTQIARTRTALDAGVLDLPIGEDTQLLDGLPEDFVGPLLRAVIMHEVGHTMGLTHNWKGSTLYSYEEMNSEDVAHKKPHSTSVMDYQPINIVATDGDLVQGDWDMIDIGPYDMWAIRWGYAPKGADEIAREAPRREHAFSSDEGQQGPDPHAKVWDLGENSLDYADNQLRLADRIRGKILTEVVKDNDSWQKARKAWTQTLGMQMGAIRTASAWIGGAHTNKFHKGDEGAPPPIRPVAVDRQRRALHLICESAFDEKAFGLSPELLASLGTEQWWDENGNDPQDWPVHDQILGMQASAISMLLNPTRLRRILDNEQRTPAGEDALTVPEVLDAMRRSIWEVPPPDGAVTNRNPRISSFSRNLQREHLNRLIDLATGMRWPGASAPTIQTLARQELRRIHEILDGFQGGDLDDYTRAHLADARERIDKALDAAYIRAD